MTTILAMTDAEGTITSKSENMPWEGLALRVLGTLSSKVRGPGNQERALWQALSSSLQFLEQQLARLSVGLSMAGILKFHSSISCFKFLGIFKYLYGKGYMFISRKIMLIIHINELVMFTQVCLILKSNHTIEPILTALCHNMYKASMLTFS